MPKHLYKKLRIDDYFPGTNEPSVQWLGDGSFLEKTAAHHYPEIEDYISKVSVEEGKAYILILALGCSDVYGCNRNGDWFDEDELKIAYKTFETEPAYLYRHHQNKDPDKAAGRVVKSFYNPKMRRVEILVRLDIDKAPDVVDKLKSGQPVATSMGCRVQYDVCSKCGNKAKTRAEYCDHLRYSMRKIDSDGSQVYAINKFPKFFDISLVFRPADRTSYVLKKVAAYGQVTQELSEGEQLLPSAIIGEAEEKVADLKKLSDINKIIRGYPVRYVDSDVNIPLITNFRDNKLPDYISNHEAISDSTLDELKPYPIVDTLNTIRSCGYDLTTPETTKIIIAKISGSSCSQVPELLARVIAMMLPNILSSLSNRSDVLERHLSSSNDEYSRPLSFDKISEIISAFPESRLWDDDSLIKKSSTNMRYENPATPYHPTFMEAVRAWRDKTRLDGASLYETIVITMPNGVEMVIPRSEVLNAIAMQYGERGLLGFLPVNPLNLASAVVGVASNILPHRGYYYENSPLPISPDKLMRLPGVRGKLVKRSSIGPSGTLIKTAIDFCLARGYTCGQELEEISTLPYDQYMNKLGSITLNNYKKIMKLK